MKHAQNTDAVSPVIGFILVVGILIAVLASVQLVLVPMWNQDIEYSHNQRMQSSMQQLDSKINNVMQSGTRDSITLELGADIPKRPLLFDLPNQPGSLRTGNNSVISIQNAAALNPDAADYWDGTPRNYSTRSLIFEPSYYEYDDAPRTIISNSLVYNNDTAEGTNALLDSTAVIDGRRITLVTLDGNLSVRSMSTNVDLEPVSTPTDSLAITNTTDNVTLNISTELNQTDWNLILEDQMTGSDSYVESVTVKNGFANITLARTDGGEQVTYELTLAKIGVGNGVAEETPHYLTKVRGDRASVPEGGTQVLTVEVRDRLNNPVSGAQVNFSRDIDINGNLSTNEGVTGSNGRLSVTYEASDSLPPYVLINASITSVPGSSFNASHRHNVTFNLSSAAGIPTAPSSVEGEWVNGGHEAGVVIEGVEKEFATGESNLLSPLRIELNNTKDNAVTMTSARISLIRMNRHVIEDPNTNQAEIETENPNTPSQWNMKVCGGGNLFGEKVNIGGPFHSISSGTTIDPTGEEEIGIDFFDEDGDPFIFWGDIEFFILTINYDTGRGTYFISVPTTSSGFSC